MRTHISGTRGNAHRNFGIAVAMAAVVLLSACFIPDEFDLKFDIPNSSEVSWTYDGKWQFFFSGFDPQKAKVPPKELPRLTKELGKIPGSTSVTHIDNHIWKQSISWKKQLRDAQGKPVMASFPTGALGKRGMAYWLVRITPEEDGSVLLKTVQPPKGKKLEKFIQMGYKSSGTLTIKTTGTVEQLGGPKLSKGWFSNSYSTTMSMLEGEPIVVRIKW